MNAAEYNIAVTDYADRLYGFVLKNIQQKEDAKDLVQNAFIALWENKENVEIDRCKPYLFQVCYNQTIDYYRKNKRMAYTETIVDAMVETKRTEDTMLKQTLQHSLLLLSEQERSLILLKDYEGYSYIEIGEITKLNESQVKVYLMRARLKLKEILQKRGIHNN